MFRSAQHDSNREKYSGARSSSTPWPRASQLFRLVRQGLVLQGLLRLDFASGVGGGTQDEESELAVLPFSVRVDLRQLVQGLSQRQRVNRDICLLLHDDRGIGDER